MQLVAVQLVACLGELYCLGNKLLKVEHVQRCATCRQVRLFVAQTGNLLHRQVAHSVQTCNLLPATSCMSGRGFRLLCAANGINTISSWRFNALSTWLGHFASEYCTAVFAPPTHSLCGRPISRITRRARSHVSLAPNWNEKGAQKPKVDAKVPRSRRL